ncbi:MAG: AI-2E family transporter [Desulfocapsaceae bacterium]|nr:AI-2E family transporter [Desulfocapsaceae bacterium]
MEPCYSSDRKNSHPLTRTMTSPKIASKAVLLLFVMGISAIFLSMMHQFLMTIFMAAIFSALLSPLYHRLLISLKGRENAASLLTILIIVCLVLLPMSALIGVVVAQAFHVSQSVTPWVQKFIEQPTIISDFLHKSPYYDQVLPHRDMILQKLGNLVGNTSTLLIDSLSSITKVTVNAAIMSIIMLYTMFYFLIDGKKLLYKILYYIPLENKDEQQLLQRFTSVARATIKGTLIIGIIQGTLCGLGFALAGIPSPVFWGCLMAVLSIVPSVGTAIVWGPALLILILSKDIAGAIFIGIFCGLIAGNADNLLRPRLVGKDTEMHDLFILFSTFGGISMFGIIGIVVGPIIAALFVSIWEIYGESFQEFLPAVCFTIKADKQPAASEEKSSNPPDTTSEQE